MIRQLILAALSMLMLAGAAAGADFPVRSGDHPGYSRLVVEFRTRPAWNVRRIGRVVEFRTDLPGASYDLAGVFRKISRNRIRRILPDASFSGFRIELDCDCGVRAFEVRAAAVVIDIAEEGSAAVTPVAAKASRAPANLPDISDTSRIEALVDGPILLLRGDDLPAPSGANVILPATNIAPAPSETRERLIFPYSSAPEAPLIESPATEVLTRNLARELARAASQGLLETQDFRTPEPVPADAPETPMQSNISIETAYDRIFSQDVSASIALPEEDSCANASDLVVSDWGTGAPIAEQIAELRSRLIGEFDAPDPVAVRDLARVYIHFSFGHEARLLLQSMGKDVWDREVLLDLADIVERGSSSSRDLGRLISCGGHGALWAVLSLPQIPKDSVIDVSSILLAFNGMPAHLRRHLGPGLAAKFADAGDMLAVETISNAVTRGSRPGTPARIIAEANFDNSAPRSDRQLRELATGSHPEAATALLILIDDLIRRRESVDQALIDTAEIVAFEQSGTQTGVELKVAEIRARLANGDFRVAFDALGRAAEQGTLPAAELGSVRQSALIALVRNADDPRFLSRILDPSAMRVASAAGRKLRLEIADRLVALGFPREAEAIAEPAADATDADELSYAARLAMALGNPNRAVQFARRSSGDASRRLVAEGLAAAGEHGAAARAYLELGDRETSLSEAWRAGDWRTVAERDEGPLGLAAGAVIAPPGEEETEIPPSLSRARSAAGASADLRRTLEDLLETVRGPGT